MADPRLFRLRVTFCKQGRLALLSHLEVARALERAVRRAGLPYAVSQGFSPHMRIAFGAALPVGVGGTREMLRPAARTLRVARARARGPAGGQRPGPHGEVVRATWSRRPRPPRWRFP